MTSPLLSSALLLSGLVLLDQVTKYYAELFWVNGRGNTFLILLGFSLMAGAGVTLFRFKQRLLTTHYYLLTTICAGGLSNLLDRLFYGGVRDIWYLGDFYFNVADVYVIFGVLFSLISGIVSMWTRPPNRSVTGAG